MSGTDYVSSFANRQRVLFRNDCAGLTDEKFDIRPFIWGKMVTRKQNVLMKKPAKILKNGKINLKYSFLIVSFLFCLEL